MNWMRGAALALVGGANRLAGMIGGRGRLAFAAASGLMAFACGLGWLSIWAAVAGYLWRSLPTRWVWDAAHFERYATEPEWDAIAMGAGLMLAAGVALLTPFGWPEALLGAVTATAGWLLGAVAYRAWGLRKGWHAASELNPAEWVAGLAWAGAIWMGAQ